MVTHGQVRFQIERAPCQAVLAQAQANQGKGGLGGRRAGRQGRDKSQQTAKRRLASRCFSA
jgi:hypothetical protein